ncbi:MAG: glycosyltransferase family 39 protein [Chthoniobacter sp.]|uniref:glycosyltransferase family 39 protein n=1 Tax=Chthoniobacter sp. TaxID=2510640 RepID=UPI0032ACB8A7
MSSLSRPADAVTAADDRRSGGAASVAPPARLSRTEWIVVVLALLVLGALRWLSITSHPWNSDEPQHLHVVWAWTVGLLQYRDIFDNHTPLFHILNAPLLRWLGERADIVLQMRRAMIPLFAVSVWCVYRLGVLAYDRRTGWFAALLAAFLPAFFFRMGEFRTDVMWATVWLVTLVVALSGKLTPWRTFWTALLLGAAFSISMKTTLLVLCLAVAGGSTWLLAGRPVSKALPWHVLAFLAGVLVVPGAIVSYFASQRALPALYHCVIAHNTLPGQNLAALIGKQIFSQSTLWLIPVWACTVVMLPSVRQNPGRGYRRLFLFFIAGGFYSLLRGFWPVVTTQDYLPWLPLLPIFVLAGLSPSAWQNAADHWLPGNWQPGFSRLRESLQKGFKKLPWVLAPCLILAGEIIWIVSDRPLFVRIESNRMNNLALVLRLTKPGEYVLDAKGETIFRPRPSYLVLETLTLEQLKRGLLVNDIVPRLIATRTAVVRPTERMNSLPQTQRFIQDNYIRVAGGRVLGQRMTMVPNKPLAFNIVIPERYGLVAQKGTVSGTLDGQPIDGPRALEPGRHELILTNPPGEIAVVWARALERGLSPYNISKTRDPE